MEKCTHVTQSPLLIQHTTNAVQSVVWYTVISIPKNLDVISGTENIVLTTCFKVFDMNSDDVDGTDRMR